MNTANRNKLSYTTLLLLALAFVAAVMVSNVLFKGWRLDLTENRLYTLSEGTKRILGNIEEPINLHFYFSDQASKDLAPLRSYAERVREMLEEFTRRSDGKLILNVIDPLPFSEDEDRAAQFGLRAINLGGLSDSIYLGLAGANSVGDEEIIPFFPPDREQFLEYELAKLVSSLATPEKTKIGLISGADISGSFDPQTRQPIPAWVVVEQARQLFDVKTLPADLREIDPDVNILWIVHPLGLSDQALYAIDQHVLAGGKAVIFLDPLAEAAAPPPGPGAPPSPGQGSDLETLFAAWGIEFDTGKAVGDPRYALRVNGPGGRPIRHPTIIGVDRAGMNSEDVVTADLETVNFSSAGFIRLADDSPATLEPLISTSDNAGTLDSVQLQFVRDPNQLFDGLTAGDTPLVVAARVGGTLPTAFPDGPPAGDTEEGDAQKAAADTPADATGAAHLSESGAPANLIVVADVDMLADHLWVQVQNFFGQRIPTAFANNSDFVINALDNLSGSADLITVRSRAGSARPFTRVERLRADAEADFRATEQRLQEELAETERRLGELQAARNDGNPQSLLMSPEQQAEIDRFIDQRAAIRKELRAVRRNLDKNIDRLGSILKSINIGLIPLLIAIFGFTYSLRSKRRQGR